MEQRPAHDWCCPHPSSVAFWEPSQAVQSHVSSVILNPVKLTTITIIKKFWLGIKTEYSTVSERALKILLSLKRIRIYLSYVYDIGFPGIGIKDDCKPPTGCWRPNLGSHKCP